LSAEDFKSTLQTPIDTQASVALSVLARRPPPAEKRAKLNNAPISRFDLATARILHRDLVAIEARADAQRLLTLMPSVPIQQQRGEITTTTQVSGVYVRLLLPAAIERARLTLQQRLERSDNSVLNVVPRRAPYAVANRTDAHQSLRIDELVARYALTGEVPLSATNDALTPYAQYANFNLLGRLMNTRRREETLDQLTPVEQRVSFGEGQHREFAIGVDVQLSALVIHLMQLLGARSGERSLAAVYHASIERRGETRDIALLPVPRDRLARYLEMYFVHRALPTLSEMRPVDIRLLVLVLLGFDVSSRVDNNLDNTPLEEIDEDNEPDTPIMTPSYSQMRSNTAKRCLADAYYRSLLVDVYNQPITRAESAGMLKPIRVVRVRGTALAGYSVTTAVVEQDYEERDDEEVFDYNEHRQIYIRRLRTAKLRERVMEDIDVDRTSLLGRSVAAQLASLASGGDARRVALRTLELMLLAQHTGKEDETYKLVDQPWLLVPRVAVIGALVVNGHMRLLLDTLERILITCDDSAHLLASDTTDDVLPMLAKLQIDNAAAHPLVTPAETVAAIVENENAAAAMAVEEGSTTVVEVVPTTGTVALLPSLPPPPQTTATTTTATTSLSVSAEIQRNPASAASSFTQWKTAVESALAEMFGRESVTLAGTFATSDLARLSLLEYEIATVSARQTGTDVVAQFYDALAPTLETAKFIVENVVDIDGGERIATAIDLAPVFTAVFQRAGTPSSLTGEQRELTKLLVQAELHRRSVWRPSADGTRLLATTAGSVSAFYAKDVNATFTVSVATALLEAYTGVRNSKPADVLLVYANSLKSAAAQSITGRMRTLITTTALPAKSKPSMFMERYVPLYDAIQLLFRNNFSYTEGVGEGKTADQLHPLIAVLSAPLMGRFIVRVSTDRLAPTDLTTCRMALVGVHVPTYAAGYDMRALRTAARAEPLSNVIVLHEFTFAKPTEKGKTGGGRQGHNYYTINRVVFTGFERQPPAPRTLLDLLGEDFTRDTLTRESRTLQKRIALGLPLSTAEI
jgi:hypothetical protein